MLWKGIVGARFSQNDFENYVRHLTFPAWRPQFVVVHNTSVPSLAQRPNGFTQEHTQNLVTYYRDTQEWSAGPHCFIDQNGIWVFTPLTTSGVHSPSWKAISWGIETLGDYMKENFKNPIHDNLVACLATTHGSGLRHCLATLPQRGPKTTHKDCPGIQMKKPQLILDVHEMIISRESGDHPSTGLPLV